MATSVTKLSRLSRNKTSGNVIIFVLTCIGGILFVGAIGAGVSSNTDKFAFLGGFGVSVLISYFVNKKMRQPFFIETSRYLEELVNRRFDVQQAAVRAIMIEPLQTIFTLKAALKEVDDLNSEMEGIYSLTSEEISMNSSPIHNSRIQRELKEIIKSLDEAKKEIRKKRANIIFLAEIRQRILTTINIQLSRPRNEIEYDYLFFKVQKHIQDQIVDDYLFQQIIDHILSQGEVGGSLDHNKRGSLILTVERPYKGSVVEGISWENSQKYDKHCVICRYIIEPDEDIVECPSCQNSFHRNHLLEWLKVFNQCPMCHQRLTLFSNPTS
ncbi:MAG: RING finger protein [Promethearchaeota archaeon]